MCELVGRQERAERADAIVGADLEQEHGARGLALALRHDVEDIHVIGAALGYVVREVRRRLPSHGDGAAMRAAIERAIAAIAALSSLSDAPALSASTHVALAGALAIGKEAVLAYDALVASATDPAAERFRRDRTLLGVAGAARAKRLEKAWAALGESSRT